MQKGGASQQETRLTRSTLPSAMLRSLASHHEPSNFNMPSHPDPEQQMNSMSYVTSGPAVPVYDVVYARVKAYWATSRMA